MRANAGPLLEDGEVIEQVFGAQPMSQYWVLVSLWILVLRNRYRVVIVTDRRIVVARSGRFTQTPIAGVLRVLPRSTRIGPATGLWFRTESLGERLYIHRRWHKDVAAADGAAPVDQPPPPPPP